MMPDTKRRLVAILLIVLVLLVLGWAAFVSRLAKVEPSLTKEQNTRLQQVLSATPGPLSAEQKARVSQILNASVPELTPRQKLRLAEVLGN